MVSREEFLVIIKKRHNKYFSTKQAVNAFILEFNDVAYVELKYKNKHFAELIKSTKRIVYPLIQDMVKNGMVERYSQTSWRII